MLVNCNALLKCYIGCYGRICSILCPKNKDIFIQNGLHVCLNIKFHFVFQNRHIKYGIFSNIAHVDIMPCIEPRREKTGFSSLRKQRRRSAVQLLCTADQRLCFRYTYSPLLTSKLSRF